MLGKTIGNSHIQLSVNQEVLLINLSQTTSFRVQKVAQAIRLFSPQERVQLFHLVPELRESQSTAVLRESALLYFHNELAERRNEEPFDPNDPFLGGLSYGEYLALSESDEESFWDNVFFEDVMDIHDYEEHVI